MQKTLLALSAVAALSVAPSFAFADGSGAVTGAAGGAVAGAVVGGPVGAVVGGAGGAIIGGAASGPDKTVIVHEHDVPAAAPCNTSASKTVTNDLTDDSTTTTRTTECP